jgi:hypothetical protein
MTMPTPDNIRPIDAFELRSTAIADAGFPPVTTTVVRCSYCSALVIQDSEDADWNAHVQSHGDVESMLRELRNGKADA